jgi:hypothetical protein
MGHCVSELRRIRSPSVGAETSSAQSSAEVQIKDVIGGLELSPTLQRRHEGILSQYIWDMREAVSETARVLRKEGRAVNGT